MENTTISKDELNNLSKETIIFLFMQQSENLALIKEQYQTLVVQNEFSNEQMKSLQKQITDLQEQISILTQHRFGARSEKNLPGQVTFDVDGNLIFNEAEALVPDDIPVESPIEQVITYTRKKTSKRDVSLADIDTESVTHELSEEELRKNFPNGWHELDEEVYKELKYVPGKFLVIEHHIKVYADKKKIIRGKTPDRLLSHSILTPELAAAVFNAKYVNAVPLNRLSEEFKRSDVFIPRQDMAGWMIRLNRYYLKPIHNAFKEELLKSHHLHCDETPFNMPGHSKQYMWVYHSAGDKDTHPVYLYEYPGTRGASAPDAYLKDYKGVLVTDGYESYHTLAKKRPNDLKISGCWAHARRRYAEIVKVAGKNTPLTPMQQIADEAVARIAAIYNSDNKFKELSEEERMNNRQKVVKPLVDAYFAWVKEQLCKPGIDQSSKLVKALNYSVNQEKYLRVFLDDARLPLDNNDAERSIKKFCVGKKNWQIIDSKNGAEASAMLYSLAETIKANNLKPYEYFSYLMYQLMKYPRENVPKMY